jgi:hypothetical protein
MVGSLSPYHVSASGFFAVQDKLLLPRHNGAGIGEFHALHYLMNCQLSCGQVGWFLAFIFQVVATAQCAFEADFCHVSPY